MRFIDKESRYSQLKTIKCIVRYQSRERDKKYLLNVGKRRLIDQIESL